MGKKECGCDDPQKADYFFEAVYGRGDEEKGGQTEEFSKFLCAEHIGSARASLAAALKEAEDEDTEYFGPWKILESRRKKIED